MKLVFVRHSLLSRGGDKMVLVHASHLADVGHEVSIETNRVDTVFPINPKIKIVSLSIRSKLGTLLAALVKKRDADLVIADIIPLATLLFFRNRNKVVYFAQDYDESYYSHNLQRIFIRFLYLLGLDIFKIPAITVSKELGTLLRKRFGANVTVVPNGVDTHIFRPDPSPELISLKAERKAILLLSRKDRRKGFDLGIDVIKLLAGRTGSLFEVWTVGEKVPTGSFNCLHRDFGYVNENELRRIMSSADIFLYPTRHEGFPLMPLEAMSCGCAVIATTASSAVTSRGFNALVVEIDDLEGVVQAVQLLLQDAAVKEKLVKGGFETIARHSITESSVTFEHILAQRFKMLSCTT